MTDQDRDATAAYLADKITGAIALRAEIEQLKKHNAIAAKVVPDLLESHQELLAACKALLDTYAPDAEKSAQAGGESCLHSSVWRARAAIRKATQ